MARGADSSLEQAVSENRRLAEDRKAVETKLKESEERLRALAAERDKGIERLSASAAERDEALARIRTLETQALEEQKKTAELDIKAKEYQEMLAQRSPAVPAIPLPQGTLKAHETPLLRIGQNEYSMPQIIDSSIASNRVLAKLNAEPVIWRSGNAYNDFIVEEVLMNRARDMGISRSTSQYNSLVKELALNEKEQQYLAKYLTIESFVAATFGMQKISENELRSYYEANKQEFLSESGMRTVKTLSLKFGKKDEFEKAVAAIEFRNEAVNGRPLEQIYSSRPDILVFRQADYTELPDWIREKTHELQDKEISNVISTADQYMIIQVETGKPAYRSYADVRPEIQKKLSLKQKINYDKLFRLINDIQKERYEIR